LFVKVVRAMKPVWFENFKSFLEKSRLAVE
jgi:hypothetical protein